MKRNLVTTFFLILSLGCTLLPAQNITVKGIVISAAERTPLEGVEVTLKGTKEITETNKKGRYEIKVKPNFFSQASGDTLLFTYEGFDPFEVVLNGQNRIDVALSGDAPVQKNIVYSGTAVGRSPLNMTYSYGKLEEEMVHATPNPQIGTMLQGRVPGLRVSPISGEPGESPYFQLRAANALANGQQPLIILDGIYLTGSSLADINLEDIQKVEVLKGATAAAFYGSQGANGVIQLFSRGGYGLNIGETRVTYRGEVGVSNEVNRYDINNFTNREILDEEGPQPDLGFVNPDNIHSTILPNVQNYQEDFLFTQGMIWSSYVGVEGRGQKTNFLVSGQRFRDEGVIMGVDGYTRNSFRVNLKHNVSNKFKLGLQSMYSSAHQDLMAGIPNSTQSFLANTLLLTPIFDLDIPNEEDGSLYDWDIDNTGQGETNPLYNQANIDQQVDRNRLLGKASIDYLPKDWLTFTYAASLDRSENHFEQFIEKGYLNGGNIPGVFGNFAFQNNSSNGGGIFRSQLEQSTFLSRLDAKVVRKFAMFRTAFKLGYLYEQGNYAYNEARGENLAVNGIRSLDNAQSNIGIASEQQEIIANSTYFLSDVTYKKKLMFSGLFRRETASLFGADERGFNNYRVSAGYRMSQDVKLPKVKELKLRASIGTAGIRPNFEQRFETFQLVNGTLTKNTLGNDLLRPAMATEMEMGVNATVFKAFDIEFNYVDVTTEDQILFVPLSGATGFEGQWSNAGTIKAEIYEASLNIDFAQLFKIEAKDFEWNLTTSFDRTTQIVETLDVASYNTGPGIEGSSIFRIEQGAPLGAMVGEVFATSVEQLTDQEGVSPLDFGINELGYLVQLDVLGTADEAPYKLVDANGNPIIQTIGDANPDFRMGFAHMLRYKGLRLYTLIDWKKGGDVYNLSKQLLYANQRHVDYSQNETTPASFYDGLYNDLAPNSHFVEDGSYVMMREASITYTFEADQLTGLFGGALESIRLGLAGRNLFTITDYSGVHPDVSVSGRGENYLSQRFPGTPGSDAFSPNGDPSLFAVDAFAYPLRRFYTFSVEIVF